MSINEKMTTLADAVREKAELTGKLTIDEMTAAITDLTVNGVEVDERTLSVTPSKETQSTIKVPNMGCIGNFAVYIRLQCF